MFRPLPIVGLLAGLIVGASAALPASAADGKGENGRFTILPWEDGLLRLDSRTGALSVCMIADGQVQCRAGADERAALESEIERLQKENTDLKAKLGAAPAPSPTPAPPGGADGSTGKTPDTPPPSAAPAPAPGPRAELPNDPDLERALDYAERMMRRIMRALRDERPGDRT